MQVIVDKVTCTSIFLEAILYDGRSILCESCFLLGDRNLGIRIHILRLPSFNFTFFEPLLYAILVSSCTCVCLSTHTHRHIHTESSWLTELGNAGRHRGYDDMYTVPHQRASSFIKVHPEEQSITVCRTKVQQSNTVKSQRFLQTTVCQETYSSNSEKVFSFVDWFEGVGYFSFVSCTDDIEEG